MTFLTAGGALLLVVLWGPSLLVSGFPRIGRHGLSWTTLVMAMAAELVLAAIMVYAADRMGLLNPAGYVLASVVFAAVAGASALRLLRRAG